MKTRKRLGVYAAAMVLVLAGFVHGVEQNFGQILSDNSDITYDTVTTVWNFSKLSVTGAASFADGAAATPSITNTGDLNTGIWFPAADTVAISTAGVERVRADAAGNVGIGVTPKAWHVTYKALQLGGLSAVWGYASAIDGANTRVTTNAYYDGAYKRIYNEEVSFYSQVNGTHLFQTSGADAADSVIAFTTGMTIANDGDTTGGTAGGWALQNVAASATVPTLCPNNLDITSGIGVSTIYPMRFITNSLSTLLLGVNTFDITTNKHCNLFNTRTYTDTHAAGTNAYASYLTCGTPAFASTEAITITDAASVMILNPPTAGTNTTITNPWALWVDAGNVRLDGGLYMPALPTSNPGAGYLWNDSGTIKMGT